MGSISLKANTFNTQFFKDFKIGCEFEYKDACIFEQHFIDLDQFNLNIVLEVDASGGQGLLPITIE